MTNSFGRLAAIGAAAALVFGTTTASAGAAAGPGDSDRAAGSCADVAGVVSTCGIQYLDDLSRSHSLDFFRPAGDTSAPVVIFIHGGSWMSGTSAALRKQAQYFARNGLAAISVNYTLSTPDDASWPTVLDDVQAAVEWARTEGAAYGFDGSRIGTYGSSAGGHLAAMLGATNANGIIATVSLSGPMDVTSTIALPYNPATQLLGCDSYLCPTMAAAASPDRWVDSGDGDFLLFSSEGEKAVPPSQTLAMDAALNSASVSHEIVILPGALHASAFQCTIATVQGKRLPVIDASFSYLADRLVDGVPPKSEGYCSR